VVVADLVADDDTAGDVAGGSTPDAEVAAPVETILPVDRHAALWPFAPDSPWNTPLGAGVAFEPEDGPMTEALHAEELDGDVVGSWLNSEEFSIPVVQASADDPVVEIDDAFREDAAINLPEGAGPAAGTDGHLVVIRPDGRHADEFFSLREGDDGWTSERHHVTDLLGSGLGPEAGVRAYGGSALGGLVRRWEVDRDDPGYTDGVIRHALAVALPASMLRYDDGEPGYDDAGYGTALGYVWPATEQDYDSPEDYGGPIPMGTLLAIPPDIDLGALDLPRELHAIATALQTYGAYVVDRAAGAVTLYAEPGVPDGWLDVVRGPDASAAGLERLRQLLRVVTNNAPTSVGGGGERRAAPAPPFSS